MTYDLGKRKCFFPSSINSRDMIFEVELLESSILSPPRPEFQKKSQVKIGLLDLNSELYTFYYFIFQLQNKVILIGLATFYYGKQTDFRSR